MSLCRIVRVLSCLLLLVTGCNDDADGNQQARGEAGAGGEAAAGESAGGDGGSAGDDGQITGEAGEAGAAPQGGMSGSGGDGSTASDAGVGPSAGATPGAGSGAGGQHSSWDHCATAPESECTLPETCEAADGCNPSAPFLDSDGCLKRPCETSDDCSPDSRCVPRIVRTYRCHASVVESCEVDSGENRCVCSTSADCEGNSYCLPLSYPLCDLEGATCQDLDDWAEELEPFVSDEGEDESIPELAVQCQNRISQRRSELACD